MAVGPHPSARAALPHRRLHLRRDARPLALPGRRAALAARVRPRAAPGPLPRPRAGLQRLPAEARAAPTPTAGARSSGRSTPGRTRRPAASTASSRSSWSRSARSSSSSSWHATTARPRPALLARTARPDRARRAAGCSATCASTRPTSQRRPPHRDSVYEPSHRTRIRDADEARERGVGGFGFALSVGCAVFL